jgi:hypothetical protein
MFKLGILGKIAGALQGPPALSGGNPTLDPQQMRQQMMLGAGLSQLGIDPAISQMVMQRRFGDQGQGLNTRGNIAAQGLGMMGVQMNPLIENFIKGITAKRGK